MRVSRPLQVSAINSLFAAFTTLSLLPRPSPPIDHSPRGITISDVAPLGQGWTISSKDNPCFIPIVPAALFPEDFYQALLLYALATNRRENGTVVFSSGLLPLATTCCQSVVPWIFVRNYARRMIDMTRLGYTGRYFSVMRHADTGTEIMLALDVMKDIVRGQ